MVLPRHDTEEDDPVEVGPDILSLSGPHLADVLVDSLDTGLVLCDLRGKILRANPLADHMLAAFGPFGEVMPTYLWERLRPLIEAAASVPTRFTPASPILAPDKRRFFLRCRDLRGQALLLTIAAAALREIDVERVLADHFGLNAQEIRIAFLAAQGYRNREIAERLSIVEGTVKNYLTAVFSALSVRSRTELASELAQLVEDQTDVYRRP